MAIREKIINAIIKGNASEVKSLVEVGLQLDLTPREIIDSALLPGIINIGEKFKQNRLLIPDVLMASRAIQAGFYTLEPVMKETAQEIGPKVVIGTVAGDLHDIGKQLLVMMLQGAGMKVIDLGIDVPAEVFVKAVQEHHPDIVGMSALLTITMPALRETVDALERENLRQSVKVIVGGSPVTWDYAMGIGADGYADSAYESIGLIQSLLR
ncbi:corrinoid protein [Candidatus Formimonas warabiya]|uniref:Methyltransferase n=1 Tax=Formimonas warabiya TaxID=1761012 RepID=A0A3G1KZR1_FORW1|nr:corrinoid protein [Candidatus Formimonas warabiya]ATW27881.1 methyltransferase [Candidatus Formimonas warabiya]